jgi:hypothetical protein
MYAFGQQRTKLEPETVYLLLIGSGYFRTAIAAVFGLARTHQLLASNDKTKLTPDDLSKRKTFFRVRHFMWQHEMSTAPFNAQHLGALLAVARMEVADRMAKCYHSTRSRNVVRP